MKLNFLNSLLDAPTAIEINELSQQQIKELQQALNAIGYEEIIGEADGLFGPKTAAGWKKFKEDEFQNYPTKIGAGSISLLAKNLKDCEDKPTHDFSSKSGTIKAIISECKRLGLTLNTQIAYVLATVEHETAYTFTPLSEYGGKKTRYAPYYGRGYVQLTWKANYAKYSKILGIDMVKNPDLAKNPNVALFILVHGFKTGAFTGLKMVDFINNTKTDFIGARRIINGRDRDRDIAKLAEKWLKTLK